MGDTFPSSAGVASFLLGRRLLEAEQLDFISASRFVAFIEILVAA